MRFIEASHGRYAPAIYFSGAFAVIYAFSGDEIDAAVTIGIGRLSSKSAAINEAATPAMGSRSRYSDQRTAPDARPHCGAPCLGRATASPRRRPPSMRPSRPASACAARLEGFSQALRHYFADVSDFARRRSPKAEETSRRARPLLLASRPASLSRRLVSRYRHSRYSCAVCISPAASMPRLPLRAVMPLLLGDAKPTGMRFYGLFVEKTHLRYLLSAA